MYDTTDPGTRGSVTVINYKTYQKIKNIKTNMAEPHGIAVDDASGLVYVANRNITGPIPHHTTSCGGKIGGIVSSFMLITSTVFRNIPSIENLIYADIAIFLEISI